MNRIEKLQRMMDIADELNHLQQELSGAMNRPNEDVRDLHNLLEDLIEDADRTLASLEFWTKEVK